MTYRKASDLLPPIKPQDEIDREGYGCPPGTGIFIAALSGLMFWIGFVIGWSI